MKIQTYDRCDDMRGRTYLLWKKMLSPLSGLDKSVSFMLRGRFAPKFYVAGGDLTGVHMLRNQPAPPTGFYHIGGCGIERQESMIRTLGETVERYAQFVSEIGSSKRILFASYEQMKQQGRDLIDPEHLAFYSSQQFLEPGFPYQPFSVNQPIGWLQTGRVNGSPQWVPAQLFLVGYTLKRGEPWLQAAVTTGSAAHITKEKAAINAILEIIQLDTSMGHWYSSAHAEEIIHDQRTQAIQSIIGKQFHPAGPRPHFYRLKSPDLPGFTIACILKQAGTVPRISIGQSCELKLRDAMYKAMLEAVGVYHLARLTGFEKQLADPSILDSPGQIRDLDTNVAYYGIKGAEGIINEKFPPTQKIRAADLPPDYPDSFGLTELVNAFVESGKSLFQMDTTTEDIASLGFHAWRYWSPDTLTLCLPGLPVSMHKRFQDFGGFANPLPHPYP